MRLVTAVLSIVMLGSTSGVSAKATPAQSRRKAPTFVLSDANGSPVRLWDYKGKVVVLDFWATWCTGCKVEIPWFMEFQNKYKSQGLGNAAALAKQFNITGLPLTLLIDREGRIADAHAGMVDKDGWEQEVREVLKERPR